jgi:hypothetical protein
MNNANWKPNWSDTKRRFVDWWNGKGFIVGSWAGVRLSRPHADVPDPGPPKSLEQQWYDLDWRIAKARHTAAWTGYPLETLPVADPWLGPGSLAAYLGSPLGLQEDTVWYEPCIADPLTCPPIRLDTNNRVWRFQLDLLDRMIATSNGDYLVGCPDVIENWDTLASLRGAQELLVDMVENPRWVKESIARINQAWFEVDEALYRRISAQDGETMFGWFRTWAPGRVAKVQCDGCSMFSPEMFREFVVPGLTEQCDRLDYSLYHLDGSQCMDKLDALLEIESLTAIEWTPDPRVPSGGSSHWYPLYRRILAAGKRVQVLSAAPHEIAPMLDACGHDGVYFLSFFSSEAEAEAMERAVAKLR